MFKEKNKEKLQLLILALSDYSFSRKNTLKPEALELAKELEEELTEAYRVMQILSPVFDQSLPNYTGQER